MLDAKTLLFIPSGMIFNKWLTPSNLSFPKRIRNGLPLNAINIIYSNVPMNVLPTKLL